MKSKPIKELILVFYETGENDDVYNFETVNQITITINVIGEIQGESEENTEDPLLPGPSFLSVILAMCALVYRRRKV